MPAKPGCLYRFKSKPSFFVVLDAIAAISLLPEVLWAFGGLSVFEGAGPLTLARAGRAARAGTRAARIVRILKLLTLFFNRNKVKPKDEEDARELQPSRIGSVLSERITQKVILIVAAMLLAASLLDMLGSSDTESLLTTYRNLGAMWAAQQLNNATDTAETMRGVIQTYIQERARGGAKSELIYAAVNGTVFHSTSVLCDALRRMPNSCIRVPGGLLESGSPGVVGSVTLDGLSHPVSTVNVGSVAVSFWAELNFDNSAGVSDQAVVNFLQVAVVIVVLAASSALFSKDSQELVVRPLEKMTDLVRRLASNPLAQIEDGKGGEMETDFVESALKKFGKLLQIAFGEAGAGIIANNLSGGGELNPMVPGLRKDIIVGFCDIRGFTDCTECLQEEVMVFVNKVANYVHSAVRDNLGAPNKNIGEAFLLVWRKDQVPDSGTVADHALRGFVRVCCETNACPVLARFTQHPMLQERMPGFKMNMGFGLHTGWAIEGAIGSKLKIDASYLSPNVNISSRLEAATRQYGVSLLMSDEFVGMLSPPVRDLCRRVDRVTVKGSKKPMEFWTYDVPTDVTHEQCVAYLADYDAGMDVDFWQTFAPRTTAAYRAKFKVAVDAYVDGKWGDAKPVLEECLAELPDDSVVKVLQRVMGGASWTAPSSWVGVRELTSK